MARERKNGSQISSKITLALISLLVLSGCKTTSEGWVLNVERTQREIKQTLVEDDWSTGVSLIRHIHKKSYDELMPWLKERAHTFPPVYLYAMADRMRKVDKDGTVQWFVAARVRHTYDLLRCQNAGALQRLGVFAKRFQKSVFKYAGKNADTAYEAALSGLAWDVDNPIHLTSPVKECMLSRSNYSARSYSPFGGVYYPIVQRRPLTSALLKPSWTHGELLDLARVKAKRFVEDLKFSAPKNKGRNSDEDEDEEAKYIEDYPRHYSQRRGQRKPWRLSRSRRAISGWRPLTE